jgi:hypothetical protein
MGDNDRPTAHPSTKNGTHDDRMYEPFLTDVAVSAESGESLAGRLTIEPVLGKV